MLWYYIWYANETFFNLLSPGKVWPQKAGQAPKTAGINTSIILRKRAKGGENE